MASTNSTTTTTAKTRTTTSLAAFMRAIATARAIAISKTMKALEKKELY
jgi:hypothetical protein